MTVIDAEAVVGAPITDVWPVVVRPERWGEWFASGPAAVGSDGGAMRLVATESLSPVPDQIGARRRCTAIIAALPLARPRHVAWEEQLSDLRWPWTVEYAAEPADAALRRWRMRLTVVPQLDGATRIHGRVAYAPRGPLLMLADALFVRRAVSAALAAALNRLAGSFAAGLEAGLVPDVVVPDVAVPDVAEERALADLVNRAPSSTAA